jgi:hypothetical protein
MLRSMPEIEITPEQEERLRALQEEIASDVVGKYGHVRPRDAVEYLLDRYAEGDGADAGAAARDDADGPGNGSPGREDGSAGMAGDEAATGGAPTDAGADEGGSNGGNDDEADDAMLDEMMNLLDTHDDKWGESSGDERYAVDLPDGSSEQVRTKDDVKALLFEHYR